MPHLPYSIELHDSKISMIKRENENVVLHFSHAYIHDGGNGYSQELEIIFGSAHLTIGQVNFPARIADGKLRTNLGPYHNLLNLPLDTDGEVKMSIEFDSDEVATIRGNGIRVKFLSERKFLEPVNL
jgi:hypothetical protein